MVIIFGEIPSSPTTGMEMFVGSETAEEVRHLVISYINTWSWLSANLHSIASGIVFGHQKLLTVMDSLGLWGTFNHTEAVYYVEIDHYYSSSSQEQRECRLEVTKACNVTSDWRNTFGITKPPLNPSWSLPYSISDCCIDVSVLGMFINA